RYWPVPVRTSCADRAVVTVSPLPVRWRQAGAALSGSPPEPAGQGAGLMAATCRNWIGDPRLIIAPGRRWEADGDGTPGPPCAASGSSTAAARPAAAAPPHAARGP